MRIQGWLSEKKARLVRCRWSSVVATGMAVMVIAFCPLPTEGNPVLADIGGAGLGGEIMEQVVRLAIWTSYKGIQRIAQTADYLRHARHG